MKASQSFGPNTTADEIVTAKPDVVKQWNQLAAHTGTLDAVSAAYRTLLANVTRELPDDIVSLFVADAPDVHEAGEFYRDHDRWLALACAGYTLTLNTPDEARGVIARAEAVLAEQARLEHEERVAKNRFRHRFELKAGAK